MIEYVDDILKRLQLAVRGYTPYYHNSMFSTQKGVVKKNGFLDYVAELDAASNVNEAKAALIKMCDFVLTHTEDSGFVSLVRGALYDVFGVANKVQPQLASQNADFKRNTNAIVSYASTHGVAYAYASCEIWNEQQIATIKHDAFVAAVNGLKKGLEAKSETAFNLKMGSAPKVAVVTTAPTA